VRVLPAEDTAELLAKRCDGIGHESAGSWRETVKATSAP
jgi:hypothetical protein